MQRPGHIYYNNKKYKNLIPGHIYYNNKIYKNLIKINIGKNESQINDL